MTETQSPYLTHREAQFVKFYQAGRSSRWGAAVVAARIVGTYDGRTKELAKGLCVSEDVIEGLAQAYIVYHGIKKYARKESPDMFRAVSELRRKLSISHWAAVGHLAIQRDWPPLEQFALLKWAADEDASRVAMLAQVGESERPEKGLAASVRSLIVKLQDLAVHPDAPPWLQKWAGTQSKFLQSAADKRFGR